MTMILSFLVSAFLWQAPLVTPFPQMVLPDGNGVWVIHVVTSGGLTGTGAGNFSISSEGKVACSDVQCFEKFAVSEFNPLVEVLRANLPSPGPSPLMLCNDCIRRTITISRRDALGVVTTYTASWDDIS